MDRFANALSILSDEPFLAELSDCLLCGGPVPAHTPWYENGSTRAMVRYRVCRSCLSASVAAVFRGGAALERVQEKLVERLTVIGNELDRRSALLDSMPTQTKQ